MGPRVSEARAPLSPIPSIAVAWLLAQLDDPVVQPLLRFVYLSLTADNVLQSGQEALIVTHEALDSDTTTLQVSQVDAILEKVSRWRFRRYERAPQDRA